jgi:uncharacterized membrane protein
MQWWGWVLIGVGAGALIMLVAVLMWFISFFSRGFWN